MKARRHTEAFHHSRQAYEATYVNTFELQRKHHKVAAFTLMGRGESVSV